MKFNFFDILKQMFGNKTEDVNTTESQKKYKPDPCDLLIIAGDSSLILTSDRRLGGLWNYIDFSPCSGSTSDYLAEMKTLLADSLDEAYDAALFPLDGKKSFLLNMADCINRSACDEDSEFYKKHIDDKLDVFYPIIKMFAEKNSPSKIIGIMIYYGGGTGIGLSHLSELLINDGFNCIVEGSKSPFSCKDYLSESLARKSMCKYEEFDNKPYNKPSMSLMEYCDTVEEQHLSSMKDRLRERINNEIQTKGNKKMNNLLLSAAIGDIGGEPYEFGGRTKDYNSVSLLLPQNTYTDDTVCTFACADALLHNLDMAMSLRIRCRADMGRGFGGMFARWLIAKEIQPPYNSFGNGSGMRVSAAGFMAKSKEECIEMATRTALPTHNHPEGIKGAVATALAIFYGMQGHDKDFIRSNVLDEYYPEWGSRTYDEIKPAYDFDETCQKTIPAALICFLESNDYEDCLKLAIALGGDADTLAAIAGPMAYAFYREIPEELIKNAKAKLPEWMLEINEELDNYVNYGTSLKPAGARTYNGVVRPDYTPNAISSLKADEVFVFGSNLYGHHSGGAARVARKQFGAIWGQGVGLQGQSYAIPTMQGGVETIKPYVNQFIGFAREHAELFFYVTRIGCGIAGFKDGDIAPLFQEAIGVDNICLPESFVNILKDSTCSDMPHAPKSYKMMMYGQCRTFADIVKTLNGQKHYHSFEELFPDFGEVIEKYQQRGAFCQDSLDVMERVLHNNKDELFEGNRFHMERFVEKLEMAFDDKDKSEIDLIFVNRQRAKLLILLKTLNDICHYTDVEDLRYHLLSVATGRWNCGDNSYMNDPLPRIGNWPINWFLSGLQEQWNNVTVNGELDNQLLEQVMFTSHTIKVREMGIEQVIANDFTADGPCHPEVFYPKNPGTAPVYVKDKFSRRYLKACGEGKGPRSGHELYEMELVRSVLRQEVSKGHYELLGGRYYIPVGTLKKPVFIEYLGRVHFASLNEKRRFIDKVRRENEGC